MTQRRLAPKTKARTRASQRFTNGQIYAVPTVLALVSLAGLVSALVGDGAWDAASWIALGVPLLVMALCLMRART